MILPTKGISPHQSLVSIGGDVLELLSEAKTVSRLWSEFADKRGDDDKSTFDWFVLSLDFLFILGAVNLNKGRVYKTNPKTGEASK